MKKNKIFFVLILTSLMMINFLAAANNSNIEVTDVSPTSLVPGEKTKLEFKVENTGNMDLSNVIFSWEEKTGIILPIGSSNTKSIDSIDRGDSETFDFDVFTSASASPGLYELTLTIKSTDENGTLLPTEISNAGIIVGGQTDFDVSVSDVSSSGVVLSVANIGKNPANSVTVIIPEQSNFKVSGSSSSIIGNLGKGDYSVASFQISSLTRSSSTLNIEIQYTDTIGVRQTLKKTVEVQSLSSQTTQSTTSSTTGSSISNNYRTSSNSPLLIIGFVTSMVLTIGVIIFVVKKNRKKNENN
jgi:hypothetical protein